MFKKFAAALVLALMATLACAQQPAKYKVVFQVSDADPAKWALALGNVRNLQADVGKDNVQVEVVAYGPGLAMLREDSKMEGRLAEALENNVGLIACENTMRATKTAKTDLYPGVRIVSAGVSHLVKRQSEGWAYIRP